MNREETLAIMGVLKAAYPNYYKDMKRDEAEGIVALWTEMFKDDPATVVGLAVKAHIANDKKGFPPHIGAIKDAIVKLKTPGELELSELEAWNLVRRAIHGASIEEWSRKKRYGDRTSAQYNFDNLPEVLQHIVGSPSQLAQWEKLDDDEIDTVLQSNFMRSYRAKVGHVKEQMALPAEVREAMKMLGGSMRLSLGEGFND